MKKYFALLPLIFLLLVQSVFAQSFIARRNDSAATVQILANGQLGALAATDKGELFTQSTLRAGTALVGKVGIDQTTPGTTNGVGLEQIGATTVATGNGVVGAGVQRVSVASDNTAFSVNATLQAGSALAGKVGIDQTTPGTTNGVQVNAALPAGTALIGKTGIDQTTPGTTNHVYIGTDGTVTIAAGSAILGKVGIDQTTPGTTNGVALAQIGANTVLAGNGVTGTGSQRVTIASDNTAFSVNSTLQAGSALVGKVGIDQTTPGITNAVQAVGHTLVFEGGTIAFGSLTGSFANVLANASNHAYVQCTFTNSTNQPVAWDDGTNAIVQYQAGPSFQIRDFVSDGGKVTTAIRAKYLTAPTSGAVYADCGY